MRVLKLVVLVLLLVGPGCGTSDAGQRVLFVGNSYTHGNELPAMVEAITAANGTTIDWSMIAPGGAQLQDHRANAEVIEAIQSGDFDVVIFQEQSQIPSSPALAADLMIPAARALDAVADEAGVRVIWFQTWAHRDGWPQRGHLSYESMRNAVNATYAEVGRETGASVAGAGARWSRFRAFGEDIELHHADGVHATPAGSYLAALALADALLLGAPLIEAPSVAGVDDDLAQQLLST